MVKFLNVSDSGMFRFIPDCYKNQKVWDKAIDNYSHALEFIPDWCNTIYSWCYKTQKMCDKAADWFLSFLINSVWDRYKSQEMCFQRSFYGKILSH